MNLFDIDRLSFSYDRVPVVEDFSAAIHEGCFYGIIGPNGSGKTTVLDLLTRHIRPDRGTIRFRGKDLGRYSRKALSRELSLVSQNFYINFPFTVWEIVMMGRYPYMGRFRGPSSEDHRIVLRAMEQAGIGQFRNRYVTELSGGERQRVVVARVFAQDTEVMILDEATSNLDVKHALSLLGVMRREVRKRKKTVISVFQDINLALLFCDRLIVMKEGRVDTHGEPESVMTDAMLRRVFGVVSKVRKEPFADALQVTFREAEA